MMLDRVDEGGGEQCSMHCGIIIFKDWYSRSWRAALLAGWTQQHNVTSGQPLTLCHVTHMRLS